jgi:hypothetical protein
MPVDQNNIKSLEQRIAEEVRIAPIKELPGWLEIVDYYTSQRIAFDLFAIECNPDSIAVHPDRRFDGRVRVLMEYDAVYPDGFTTLGSQTFPGMVYGRIDPRGEIHVERFRFSRDGKIPPEGFPG